MLDPPSRPGLVPSSSMSSSSSTSLSDQPSSISTSATSSVVKSPRWEAGSIVRDCDTVPEPQLHHQFHPQSDSQQYDSSIEVSSAVPSEEGFCEGFRDCQRTPFPQHQQRAQMADYNSGNYTEASNQQILDDFQRFHISGHGYVDFAFVFTLGKCFLKVSGLCHTITG